MSINKPYYGIYRPMVSTNIDISNYDYITDDEYSFSRKNHLMSYSLMIDDMCEILKYIELDDNNYNVYSHKIYALLLRACTEIESIFKGVLIKNKHIGATENRPVQHEDSINMKEYFLLNSHMKLSKYSATIQETLEFTPFAKWNNANYTALPWYQAYNDVKHNRNHSFINANFKNMLNAVSGLYILLYAQYNSYTDAINQNDLLAISINNNSNPFILPQKIKTISIKDKPKFTDNEKYDFNWNSLKRQNGRFQILSI